MRDPPQSSMLSLSSSYLVPYPTPGFTVGIPRPEASDHFAEVLRPATDCDFLQIASIFSETIGWGRLPQVRSMVQSSVLDSILSSQSRVSSNSLAIYLLFCILFSRWKCLMSPK